LTKRKSKLKKRIWYSILVILLVVFVAALIIKEKALSQISVGTGFVVKKACSYYFIAERDLDEIIQTEFNATPMNLISPKVTGENEITASLFGLGSNSAVYKKNIGCILIHGEDDYNITAEDPSFPHLQSTLIPKAAAPPLSKLKSALQMAMDKEGEWIKQTTGLMVIHKDSIILEGYAAGYDSETEILGWSMTKSIAALLIGRLLKEGKINLDQSSLFPEWENDERKNIQLKHLLNMTSGLEWTEQYEEVCDVTQGLFTEEDFVSFAIDKSLEKKPGTFWEYSSGTTNIISAIIRQEIDDITDYLSYPNLQLFSKLGISDAHIETDEAGNMIMSSFGYAKLRDWAKLGMLVMNKGQWEGAQLIDSSYIDFCITPTVYPNYGGQIWLNTNQTDYPSAPSDMFYFSGFDGQYVFMFPSQDLMILRTGVQKESPFNMDAVIREVMQAIN